MNTFKKIFISVFCFFLIIFLSSAFLIGQLIDSEWEHCFDLKNRDRLAGTIELLICGASQGMNHYNTHVIDEQLCTCYNISGPAISWEARTVLLEEELIRNPVKYVIIDISHNSLVQLPSVSGEYYALPRLFPEDRQQYFFREISFNDRYGLYGKLMNESVQYLASKYIGGISVLGTAETVDNCNYDEKGFRHGFTGHVALAEDEILTNRKIKNVELDFPEKNLLCLDKMVSLCWEYGAKPIIIQSIASDRLNWEYNGLQELHDFLKGYCAGKNCWFIDGNLLKDRYRIFNDSDSFGDDQHMCVEGATAFSEIICGLLKAMEANNDLTARFYPSYDAMLADSPYMKYYTEHINA